MTLAKFLDKEWLKAQQIKYLKCPFLRKTTVILIGIFLALPITIILGCGAGVTILGTEFLHMLSNAWVGEKK